MAEIGYILKQDIVTYLADNTLDQLTGGRKAIGSNPAVSGNDSVWQNILKSEIETMLGYTRHWYDMDTETRQYNEYDITENYTEGQRVASTEDASENRRLFVAIQDAPAGTSLTDTTFFNETDDRNSVLVKIVCYLVIYELSRRLNPKFVPEQRSMDYENGMKMLKDIQTGKMQLSIAQRESVEADDAGQQFSYGDFEGVSHDDY